MAGAIISELVHMPAHIPEELCFRRGSTVCCLVGMRKTKQIKTQTGKFGEKKMFEPSHPLESRRNLPLGLFSKSLCAEMFLFLDSLLWTAARTFCVLWMGDCIMPEWLGRLTSGLADGRLQGNVEHLRKAAGLLSTADSLKMGSWIRQALPE